MKRLFTLFVFIYSVCLFAQYKIDPLLLSEFADSFGSELNFSIYTSKNNLFNNIKSDNNAIISFEEALPKIDDSLYEIILCSKFTDYEQFIDSAVIINDSLISGYSDFATIKLLSEQDNVDYIYISKPMFQSNDSAQYYAGIYSMHEKDFFGEGIIAGFIDNGFSSNISLFKENDLTKFIYIWNQKLNRLSEPEGFYIGEEISGNYIYNYPIYDSIGHGTSVLASFASSDSIYGGVLSKSDIIAVNVNLTSKSVIEGIKYINDKCEQLNKPFVIELPLNHFWGTHSGDEPLDDVINYYFSDWKSGRAISVPAGNLGNKYFHFSSNTISGDTNKVVFENKYVLLQGIKDYRTDIDLLIEDTLFFRFITIDNGNLIVSDWINPYENDIGYYYGEEVSIRFAYQNLKKQIHVIFEHDIEKKLAIEFVSNYFVDGYIAQGGFFFHNNYDEKILNGDNINTIACPGLAEQAITSGAFLSRQYIDESLFTPDSLYSISLWNGRARQNNMKPDVFAPGKFIISYSAINNSYQYFMGTSYASAFTAGGLGILLELFNDLTVKDLRNLLYAGLQEVYFERNDNDSIWTNTGIINILASYNTTGVMKNEFSYSIALTNDNYLKIVFNNIDRINYCEKRYPQNTKLIIENNKVLDKFLIYGKNTYKFIIIDRMGNKKMETINYLYIPNKMYDNIYNVLGRPVNKIEIPGIYFIFENNKAKKIFKF